MDNEFVNHYFQTYKFNKEVLKNVEGSVREYLFYENFSNIKFYVPSLPEQQKIADYLSTLNSKFEKEKKKLESLKKLKKGLMQQMFI
jgi:type I restriction enzyme S subunit